MILFLTDPEYRKYHRYIHDLISNKKKYRNHNILPKLHCPIHTHTVIAIRIFIFPI